MSLEAEVNVVEIDQADASWSRCPVGQRFVGSRQDEIDRFWHLCQAFMVNEGGSLQLQLVDGVRYEFQ